MLTNTYLATITNLHEKKLELSLPEGKTAFLPLKEINEYLKIDIEKDLIKKVSDVFSIGRKIICAIKSLESNKEFSKAVYASYNPSLINQNLRINSIGSNTILYGVISDIEDHGFLVDSGIANKLCFINNDQMKNKSAYFIGLPVFFKFTSENVKLSTIPGELVPMHQIDSTCKNKFSEICPGSYVKGVISDVSKEMIKLMVANLEVIIKSSHLIDGTTYSVNEELTARIIKVDHLSKTIEASLLSHIIDAEDCSINAIKVPLQEVLEDCEIIQLDKKSGIVMFAYDGIKFRGLFKRDAMDGKFNSSLSIGGHCKCKVVRRLLFEQCLIVSIDPKDINNSQKISKLTEVGETVEVEILKVKERSYLVKLPFSSSTMGVIPFAHMAKKNGGEQYSRGEKLKAKIFSKSLKLIHLTTLKGYMSSRLPILGSGKFQRLLIDAKANSTQHIFTGIIKNISEKGIHVHGLDNTTGLIPLFNIPGIRNLDFSILDTIYKKNKMIKFILQDPSRVNPKDNFFILSIQQDLEEKATPSDEPTVQHKIKLRSIYKCTIWGNKPNGFSVNLQLDNGKTTQAFLPFGHCTDTPNFNHLIRERFTKEAVFGEEIDFPLDVVVIQVCPIIVVSAKTILVSSAKDIASGFFPLTSDDVVVGATFYGWIKNQIDCGLIIQIPDFLHLVSLCPIGVLNTKFNVNTLEAVEKKFPKDRTVPITIKQMSKDAKRDTFRIQVDIEKDLLEEINHADIVTDTIKVADFLWSIVFAAKYGICSIGSHVKFSLNKTSTLENNGKTVQVGIGYADLKKAKEPIRSLLLNPKSDEESREITCQVMSLFYANEPCLILATKSDSLTDPKSDLKELKKMFKLDELDSLLIQDATNYGYIPMSEIVSNSTTKGSPVSSVKNNLSVYSLFTSEISGLLSSVSRLGKLSIQKLVDDNLIFTHAEYPCKFVCHVLSSSLDLDQIKTLLQTSKVDSFRKMFMNKESRLLHEAVQKTKKLISISFLEKDHIAEGKHVLGKVANKNAFEMKITLANGTIGLLHRLFANDKDWASLDVESVEKFSVFQVTKECVILKSVDQINEGIDLFKQSQPKVNDVITGIVRHNIKFGLAVSINPLSDVLIPISKAFKIALTKKNINLHPGDQIIIQYLNVNRAVLNGVVDDALLFEKNYISQLEKLESHLEKKNLHVRLEKVKLPANNKIQGSEMDTIDDLEDKYKDYLFTPSETIKKPLKRKNKTDEEKEESMNERKKAKNLQEKEMEIVQKECEKGRLIQQLDNDSLKMLDFDLLKTKEAFELAISNRPNILNLWLRFMDFTYKLDSARDVISLRQIYIRAINYFSRETNQKNDSIRANLVVHRLNLECDYKKNATTHDDLDEVTRIEEDNVIVSLLDQLKGLNVVKSFREAINVLITHELFTLAETYIKWLIKQVQPASTNIIDWTTLIRINFLKRDVKSARNYQINAAKFLKTSVLQKFAIQIAKLELEFGDCERGFAILEEQTAKNVKTKEPHLVYIEFLVKANRQAQAKSIADAALKNVKGMKLSDITQVYPDYSA